jgi:hypothetical protein
MRASLRVALGVGVLTIAVSGAACSKAAAPPPPPPAKTSLLGDMTPVVSVKELMQYMIDPASDYIFNAVGTVATKDGFVETAPKTDEDWERLRVGAVTMAEGAYLLKVRRPFAPEGDLNNSTGPDASELSPLEIAAKVDRDPVEWNARIEALRNVGLEVLEIVKRRDTAELWDAGANLDQACENCHRSYWYPKEDAEFYRKLDERLKQGASGTVNPTPAHPTR